MHTGDKHTFLTGCSRSLPLGGNALCRAPFVEATRVLHVLQDTSPLVVADAQEPLPHRSKVLHVFAVHGRRTREDV
jgi:hypothetical protein